MTFSYIHVIGALAAAIAIIMAVLLTAPNLTVGTNRLRLGVKVLCRTVAGAGYVLFLVMLVWGVTTRSETLMYTSMIPLAVALLTSKFMQRNGF
ncbi:hypothetical protein GCM10010869_61820 [Mesorhizobium tianshanense]|uniref:Uncharacterized protein n=1 Tax=Mesorhizobium tianshanense TaxID=39844 RepID=A0A562ND37_9HYPH|nr:hypothetical protein [Mesorhizobium tianshanense]TWI30024.1 hypothetical protein IQ26_04840 [Mesorhizobium tianshanense]GLS40585.1 hypothetical protein GCM10010869_61820 [Mesorhizobium tianshanense]